MWPVESEVIYLPELTIHVCVFMLVCMYVCVHASVLMCIVM